MIPFNISEAKDTGFYVSGTTQSGKSTLAKHLVQQLISEGINCYVLDVSKVWTQETPIQNVVEVPADAQTIDIPKNQSCVLDLSALSFTARIKYAIGISKALYDHHKSFGFKRAPMEFLIFEEGHTYFPNGVFRSPRMFSPAVDVVTIGANFNLRFGVITQFPASIDKALVKVCQQRYFGWSTEMNDLNYIKSFVGKQHVTPTNKDGTVNINSVFNLQKGQFLYQLRNRIEKIQSSRYTAPQSSFNLNGQSMKTEQQP